MDDPADFLDLPPLPVETLAEQWARQRHWLRYFPIPRDAGEWTELELGQLDYGDGERCVRDAIDETWSPTISRICSTGSSTQRSRRR